MSMDEIFETLNEIFRDVFDDDTIEVNENTTADDIDDWDSLEHINLIASVEQEFGIKFTILWVEKMYRAITIFSNKYMR